MKKKSLQETTEEVKVFTKEDLQEQAETFMKAYAVNKFYATVDGNFFHPSDLSLAKDHNAKVVKGELITFTIENEEVKDPSKDSERTDAQIEHANKIAEIVLAAGAMEGLEPDEIKNRLLDKFDSSLVEEALNKVSTHTN